MLAVSLPIIQMPVNERAVKLAATIIRKANEKKYGNDGRQKPSSIVIRICDMTATSEEVLAELNKGPPERLGLRRWHVLDTKSARFSNFREAIEEQTDLIIDVVFFPP